MTKRAKRLERFLSDHGWETGLGWKRRTCTKCGDSFSSDHHVYCAACGEKLPKNVKDTSVYAQLEEAIAYALGEK